MREAEPRPIIASKYRPPLGPNISLERTLRTAQWIALRKRGSVLGSPDVVPETAMATTTAVRRAPPMDELFAVATRTIDRVFICLKAGYR